jgi:hypothetical protein
VAIGKTYVEGLTDVLVKLGMLPIGERLPTEQAFKDSGLAVFDDFLLEEALIDREDLLRALSVYFKLPPFDVVGYFFDTQLLHMFPKDFLLRNAIIPREVDEEIMIMVASEPDLPDLLSQIGEHVSYDIQFEVGLQTDICDAVKEFYDESVTQVALDEDAREERRLTREEHAIELSDIGLDESDTGVTSERYLTTEEQELELDRVISLEDLDADRSLEELDTELIDDDEF